MEDSSNIFNIAQKVLDISPDTKVAILKQIPQHDIHKSDPFGIKAHLSEFANNVYDHLWIDKGCPTNIRVVSLENLNASQHLINIIYGSNSDKNFDGIHLHGKAASRHYSYQVVKMLHSYFPEEFPPSDHSGVLALPVNGRLTGGLM